MNNATADKSVKRKMSFRKLAWRNFVFHLRSNALFCAGCAVSAVVLTGALLIGSSLKESLREIQARRLGDIEWVIQMPNGGLSTTIADAIRKTQANAAPIFSRVGSLGIAGTNERAHRVNIIGVDEDFWKLGPQNTRTQNIKDNEVVINKTLAEKLNVKIGDNVIARFQNAASLTMEAPFGLRDNLSTHNLTVANIIDRNDFGDFNLQAQHFAVYNAFVSLNFMHIANDTQDKANAILIGKSAFANKNDIFDVIRDNSDISDVALNVRTIEYLGRVKFFINTYEIYSDRVFISDEIRDKIVYEITNAIPVSTWFVNSIQNLNSGSVTPYSFVSSMPIHDHSMNDDEIILSQWTADDLNAKIGDTIALTYFVPRQTSGLRTDSAAFVVSQIISDTTRWLNRSLAPPYPGLAGSESCTDWNPSIPIDLDKIRAKDEEFWNDHEATPKAIISYNRAAKIWDNRFGVTTAIRVTGGYETDINRTLRFSDLTPILRGMGMQITNVKSATDAAINNGIDFAPLFMGLSFFTLAAALMLIWLLSTLQIKSRSEELKTLTALGYSRKHVLSIYLTEGMLVFSVGTVAGVILSPLYTLTVIRALKTVWRAAAQVPELELHVDAASIIAGSAAAFVCALASMIIPVLSATKKWGKRKTAGERSARNAVRQDVSAQRLSKENVSTLNKSPQYISAQNAAGKIFGYHHLIARNIAREKRRVIGETAILACALFILGITQLFHHQPLSEPSLRSSGTGGFYWYGELDSGIPAEETDANFLRERGVDINDGDFVSAPMRVKDGDDASCLNLNQAQTPALVGVDQRLLDSLRAFSFTSTIDIPSVIKKYPRHKKRPWKFLGLFTDSENTVYGIADANTIEWGLGRSIGDTLTYINERDDTLRVIIAASLKNSIMQGKVMIAESDFIRHFPSTSGYRLLLLSPPVNKEGVVADAFHRYHDKSGLRLESTIERLNAFNAVENTYLSIFALLGMMGLALGCAGLGIVIARDIEARRREFAALAAQGFGISTIRRTLFAEHAIVAAAGLIAGLLPAFVVAAIAGADFWGTSIPRIVCLTAIVLSCGAGSIVVGLRKLRRCDLPELLKKE